METSGNSGDPAYPLVVMRACYALRNWLSPPAKREGKGFWKLSKESRYHMDLTQNDLRGSCVEGLAPNRWQLYWEIFENPGRRNLVRESGPPRIGLWRLYLVDPLLSLCFLYTMGKKLSDYLINVLPSSIRDKQTLTKASSRCELEWLLPPWSQYLRNFGYSDVKVANM